ncbi:hypothetical protein K2Y00_00985 [Patescibacteria group bacterium]|nr:hypothetical protein [Patescibacteria group bacterium]
MKIISSITLAALFVLMPLSVSAHETHVFEIGGKYYQFTIGSLNEPITVDDKTGVDLRIAEVVDAHTDHDHGAGTPVSGLEETLQVELIAGSKTKIFDLSPVYNSPGSYKTTYYPTVATTLSYRVFGMLNNTEIDLTFTCSPAGHATAEEEHEEEEISEGVTRISKTGSYGCPAPKEALGFPEESASVESLSNDMSGPAAIAISVLALLIAGYAVGRKK